MSTQPFSFAVFADRDPMLACEFRERIHWCANHLAAQDPYVFHRGLPTATQIAIHAEEIFRLPQLLRQALRLYDTIGLDSDHTWWRRALSVLPDLCPQIVTAEFIRRVARFAEV